MARLYKVSADTSEKEKIIGGILTVGQGMWLVAGAVLSVSIFVPLTTVIPPAFALFVAVPPGVLLGGMFAFYKKEQLSFLEYLTYKQAFNKKEKLLINTLIHGQKSKTKDFF